MRKILFLLFSFLQLQICFSQWKSFSTVDPASTGESRLNGIAVNEEAVYAIGSFGGKIQMSPVNIQTNSFHNSLILKYKKGGGCLWANVLPMSQNDESDGRSISILKNGDVLAAGNFKGSFTVNNVFFSASNDAIFLSRVRSDGSTKWCTTAVPVNNASKIYVNGSTTDEAGNIYLCGSFSGLVKFDLTVLFSNGNYDAFVAKYDGEGNLIWVKNMGGSGYDEASGITCSSNQNLYITGSFSNPKAIFSQFNIVFNNNAVSAGFTAKADINGNFIWVKSCMGLDQNAQVKVSAVITDPDENVYITGSFKYSASFSGIILKTISGSFFEDMFIVKYNKDGDPVWGNRIGGDAGFLPDDNGTAITYNAITSSIILAGNYRSTKCFLGNPLYNSVISSWGETDVVVSSIDPLTGKFKGSSTLNGADDNSSAAITSGPGGDTYVCGYFATETYAMPLPVTTVIPPSFFIAKYSQTLFDNLPLQKDSLADFTVMQTGKNTYNIQAKSVLNELTEIKLISMQGVELIHTKTNNPYQIDLSNYSKGCYYLIIKTGKTIITRPILNL